METRVSLLTAAAAAAAAELLRVKSQTHPKSLRGPNQVLFGCGPAPGSVALCWVLGVEC